MKKKKEKQKNCIHHCEICHTLNICCGKSCPQCLYEKPIRVNAYKKRKEMEIKTPAYT
jgi:hypothetical protein